MNQTRRNMLIAFAVGIFGWFLRPLLSFAKSSKTLSELVSIRPYPFRGTETRIRYLALHRRSDMQLLWLDVDVAAINTRPTAEAYAYFAREGLYGFKPDDETLDPAVTKYLIPFKVHNHSNMFRLDMNDPHDLKRFFELDRVFDMSPQEYEQWYDLVRTIVSFPHQHHLTYAADDPSACKALVAAQFRNPKSIPYGV